jgi:hypothetical protein
VHPLLTHLRGLAAYLLAWMLAGGAAAAALVSSGGPAWGWALAFCVPVAGLTAMAALALYYVCRSRPLKPARWVSALTARAAAAAVLAVLVAATAALWDATGLAFGRAALVTLPPAAWIGSIAAWAMVFALSALAHDALLAQQALQEAAELQTRASLHAREMELQALRSQVDPHFLFNSLNSISALTAIDAAAARAMTIDLAQFFRQSLATNGRDRIRLDEEIGLVERYVAIERRRLGDKLSLELQADDDCLQALVPPLLLQPLVENAVKHGVRLLDEGGRIEVHARRDGTRLELRVSNPTEEAAPRDATGLGQGLRLLQARLDAHCAEPAFVEVERGAQQFTVRISLPWQT